MSANVRALVEALEEVLDGEGILPMYQFAWNARGLRIESAQMEAVCQAAYDDLSRRHAFRREWFRWPIVDLTAGWPVDDDTPLDFDLDPEQEIAIPLQVLVPDESSPSGG